MGMCCLQTLTISELAGGIATQTEVLGSVVYFETNKIPIKDIAAGYFHSLFLPKDEPDTVYCTGRNVEHQLTGTDTSNKLNVCKITVNNVQKIFANAYTSYFQTTEYPLLECGYRQVNSVNVKQVTPIDVFDQVASGSFSGTHTALLSKTKYILDFDWGVENMKFGIFIVDNSKWVF
jgi:alpha-tubulin suppressor-like RCC1 family protein